MSILVYKHRSIPFFMHHHPFHNHLTKKQRFWGQNQTGLHFNY